MHVFDVGGNQSTKRKHANFTKKDPAPAKNQTQDLSADHWATPQTTAVFLMAGNVNFIFIPKVLERTLS